MKTAVKTKQCLQCGTCCLAGGLALIQLEDMNRWKSEFRHDILRVIENYDPLWVGDHMINARTGKEIMGCPFLISTEKGFLCSIYETRPLTCREYEPGSSHICKQWRG
jgi:Fe-S-cluster containining protein